jgi:hypothetical protein
MLVNTASRFTTGAFGFLTFTQSGERGEHGQLLARPACLLGDVGDTEDERCPKYEGDYCEYRY